jgi:hypothetical protein
MKNVKVLRAGGVWVLIIFEDEARVEEAEGGARCELLRPIRELEWVR